MRRSTVLLIGLVAAMLLQPTPARAQPTDLSVKAAFLPRFVRYVTWPVAAMPKGSDPFVLCVIGNDPFGNQLDQAAASQLVDGRHIAVRRLNLAAEAGACQVAFVGGNRLDQMGLLAGRPMLTVTDGSGGGQRGVIDFVVSGGRVRFFIDNASAQRRGLSISSRLLALALAVRQ
jgi:hypothetical protein